jgi:hypothetical protein
MDDDEENGLWDDLFEEQEIVCAAVAGVVAEQMERDGRWNGVGQGNGLRRHQRRRLRHDPANFMTNHEVTELDHTSKMNCDTIVFHCVFGCRAVPIVLLVVAQRTCQFGAFPGTRVSCAPARASGKRC